MGMKIKEYMRRIEVGISKKINDGIAFDCSNVFFVSEP